MCDATHCATRPVSAVAFGAAPDTTRDYCGTCLQALTRSHVELVGTVDPEQT